MDSPLPSLSLIDRYLSGGICTPDEIADIQRILARPEGRALIDGLGAMDAAPVPPAPDPNIRWKRLEKRIATETAQDGRHGLSRPVAGWSRMSMLFRTSVIAGFVCLAGGLFVATQSRFVAGTTPAPLVRQFEAARGQQATVLLADGSVVTLAPETRLKVDMEGARIRTVTLDGEAHFVVRGNEKTPFIVRAGAGVVRVLGTEFVVRHYANDPVVHVAVIEGRVSFRANADPEDTKIILAANDVAQMGPGSRVTVTRNSTLDPYLGWKNGRLIFQDVPVSQVVAELGRIYDLEFRVTDPVLAQKPITTTIRKMSVDGLVEVLSLLLQADVSRTGNVVVISPQ